MSLPAVGETRELRAKADDAFVRVTETVRLSTEYMQDFLFNHQSVFTKKATEEFARRYLELVEVLVNLELMK